MPQRNPFGFISGKCPIRQLQAILKLENNADVFRLLKANLIDLIEKHLDLKYSFSKQQESLNALKSEMKDLYPDLFATEQNEKRLYYAFRFVSHIHAARRYKAKQQGRASMTEVITTSTSRTTRSQTIKQRSSDLPLASVSIQESISQPLPRSDNRPLYIKADTPSSSPTCTMDYPSGHRAIYHFLEASFPPMTHLTNIFIDFGCINSGFLFAISLWPSERIRHILDQFPPGRDGRKLTEMEKFILQDHFKDYFA